jgi:4-hydroxythreonine-4-phosphate dehydrogenase
LKKPRIAITLGDPAGIGPEVVFAALRDARVHAACDPIVVGDPQIISQYAKKNHSRFECIPTLSQKRSISLGRPSQAAGRSAILALEASVRYIRNGHARALVTAPVSKESFALVRHGFPGHTEWLAQQSHVKTYGMLMVANHLRALLVTRHIPLADVPKKLNRAALESAAHLGFDFVRNLLKKKNPRLALCGLNPHAGDHGLLGKEENTLLRPVLAKLKRRGFPIAGPIAADAVFRDMVKGDYDLALACYHDQGMIPLKVYAPDRMVNITLGLPYIRTSPAHGTAYDIAGRGKAKAEPMIEAILLAAQYSVVKGGG